MQIRLQFLDEEEDAPLDQDSPLHNLVPLRTLQEIRAAVETSIYPGLPTQIAFVYCSRLLIPF